MLANHLFDSIQRGAAGGTPTPTEIGNEIFRDHLQRQSRQLNEKGSPESFEDLAHLGVPAQELYLPASARPLLESLLESQGLTPDEIEPLIRSATDRDGAIHLGRLMAKIRNAMRHADAHPHAVRSSDAPTVEQLLFKMGLGAGEVKEIREKAMSADGRLLMGDLSRALNEHLSGQVSEEGLTSLFRRFGIEMEPQANGLGALDRSLRDVFKAFRETSSRATRESLKFQIAGLLREKGIPPQEVKSFLDTLSVARLQGRERKPGVGTGAKLVNGLVLEDRPQWQHGTWRDAIVRILESGGQSLSEESRRGSFAPSFARWAAAGQGSQWAATPETVASKNGRPAERTMDTGPQRGLSVGSRSDQGQAQSGKVSAGVLAAHSEPARAALETAPAQQTRPSTGLPHPLPRILNRMVWMIRGGEQRSRIHVSPPELGRLDIELYVRQGGHIQANLGAETPAVKELIESNLAQLRQQLADHGLSVDRFDVMVGLADQESPRGETRRGAWRGEGPKKRSAGAGAVRKERASLSLPGLGRHHIDLHV
jgi:flagellar hook-length control protein FliK